MIIENKAKCLRCGDIVSSLTRHDFVTCSCGNLSVDGGLSYIKRSAQDPYKVQELSIVNKAGRIPKPSCFLGEEQLCPGYTTETDNEPAEECKKCWWCTAKYEEEDIWYK